MKGASSFALRLAVILGALSLCPMVAASGVNTPYRSALSVPSSAAAAASRCPDKTCASVGGGCVRSAGTSCAKSGGQCFTRGC